MQINKKLYTTIIITVLAISTILAALPLASAEIVTPPFLYEPDTTTPIGSGPVGTEVDVAGTVVSGAASPFSTVSVYFDSLAGEVLGSTSADVNGEYTIEVEIPPAVFGTHYIVVNDGETESEGTAFDVEPALSLSTIPPGFPPVRALPGDSLTIQGDGFAAESLITVTFDSTTLATPVSITLTTVIETDPNGSFTATIVVPTAITVADYDDYVVTAVDEDTNSAMATVTIDYYIGCAPPAGPTGITTTISGRIEANVAFEIRFNGAQIGSGTTAADGSYAVPYTIPGVLSPAGYPVDIVWATVDIRSTTFTVTPSPTIVVVPVNGVIGDLVSITGSGFSGFATVTLYFGSTEVNSTAMGTDFGPTSAGGALPAGLTFDVPAMAPGVYAVSIVDQYGAASATGVFFTIDPTPVTTITLRGASYYPGDTLSFNIISTDVITVGPTVTIRDPTGATWWTATWPLTITGPMSTVLFQWQLFGVDEPATLPADAPLGAWNWTITYTPLSTAVSTTATGLFSVVPLPNMQDVLDQLDLMEASIESTVTTSEGKIMALINTKSGIITADIAALNPQLQAITDTAVIIATMLGEVQVDIAALDMAALDALGVSITAIKGDVATIKTNIGTVNTAVGSLDAVLGAVAGQLVEVQTSLGTLQGTVTAIDGKVATVQTDVGTVKADITDVQGELPVDMTPAWIAVVLSLVAAVAAIFAVITIRQKIAG